MPTLRLAGYGLYCAVLSAALGALTYGLVEHFSIEALGSILVALATLILAYLTRQAVTTSILTSRQNIENENANHRVARTVELINRFSLTSVPVTQEINLTPHTATSLVVGYGKDIGELRRLKVVCDTIPRYVAGSPPDNLMEVRLQYLSIKHGIPVALSFFFLADELLKADLLDERLFMNTFAGVIPNLFLYLPAVRAEVGGPGKDEYLAGYSRLVDRCNAWIERQSATARTQDGNVTKPISRTQPNPPSI